MPHYPAARLLVPAEPPPVPEGFETVRASIVNGLPYTIDLTRDLRLKFTLPTGLLRPWLDVSPETVVASAGDERAPRSAAPQEEIGGVARPALRLALLRGETVRVVVPFALSVRRTLPDGGDPVQGSLVEVVLLDWAIHAGAVCGPGDFGSFVQFAWRRADRAVDHFGPPVINPFLWRRLVPILRIESQLGLVRRLPTVRLVTRRLALRGRI